MFFNLWVYPFITLSQGKGVLSTLSDSVAQRTPTLVATRHTC